MSEGGETAGAAMAQGMERGINNNANYVISAAENLAAQAVAIINSALEIRSPSRVMARAGSYIAQGLAEGIEDATWMVERASKSMAGAIDTNVTYEGSTPSRRGANGQGGVIRPVIMMDKKVVGEMIAPTVDESIGAEILSWR